MPRTQSFKTSLRCESCVATIRPILDNDPAVEDWTIDLNSPDKSLTVVGDVTKEKIAAALGKVGYQLIGEIKSPIKSPDAIRPAEDAPGTTYLPLLLLVAFLIGIVVLVEVRTGNFDWSRTMGNFMGGFFLAFSFFKFLDLRGFADSYRGYDVVAKRVPAYGYLYPFIELLLGIAYITDFQPTITNAVTLVVMSISSLGVIESLINKRKIRCACLGTVFNLPMSTVTLVEDGLMVAMAAFALITGSH